MATYNFEGLLSPIDFEHLVRDILSQVLDKELTAFAEGKDKGIDLRHAKHDEEIIVQCKRAKSISKAHLQKEADKVARLKKQPQQYYLATACDLSVAKTDQVKDIFKRWGVADSHIFPKNRLNDLLDAHKDIQQKHFKLWLNSALIFNELINSPLYERAKALISDIKKDYKYYVKNDSLKKSLEILNKHRFMIISGIPGIGKTTLAKLLLMEYLLNGYEVVEIRKIAEGEQLLLETSKNKQVFYFDDFLGENFLKYDVVEGRSSDLVQFIKRVMDNPNKVLIMTTREYILQQARQTYEKLDSDEFDVCKYTLDLNSYSKKIKTMILYNHLYYSGLNEHYIASLIKDNVYKRIIAHKNYSPRIIEGMTVKLKNTPPEEYAKAFIDSLDKPFKIWDKAFNGQISDGSKFTLYILLSIGEKILLAEFKVALDNFNQKVAIRLGYNFNPLDYKNYLKELEGSFVKIDVTDQSHHFVDFQNPSVKDFLLSFISDDKEIIIGLLSASAYFKQLVYTTNYLAKPYYLDVGTAGVIKKVLKEQFNTLKNPTYIWAQGKEMNFQPDVIDKIFAFRNYLSKTADIEILDFIKTIFKAIDIRLLFYDKEKIYIQFWLEFHQQLDMDYVTLLENVIMNVSWMENAKNITLLSDYNRDLYDKTLKKHISTLGANINNAIEKNIQFADSVDTLNEIKKDIENKLKPLVTAYQNDWTKYDTIIDDKIADIESAEDEDKKDESSSIINSTYDANDEEEFDEDEFFKLEMFIK